MPLQVIGSGFPRTGTTSLTAALNQLGLGPCYHMADNMKHRDSGTWIEILQAVKSDEGADKLKQRFEAVWDKGTMQYVSAVDLPAQVFYKELAEIYPNAKVVRGRICICCQQLGACACPWCGCTLQRYQNVRKTYGTQHHLPRFTRCDSHC